MLRLQSFLILVVGLTLLLAPVASAEVDKDSIYDPGQLKPRDSELKVVVGDTAPEFSLPSIMGHKIGLADYLGKKNVVLSFVPAAFTPVCSDQWPGYNLARTIFEKNNAVLLGITADNVPSLHAWTKAMGKLWFPVLSDFWPHGDAAKKYGVLRSDGTCERAIVIIDTKGVIRFVEVSDINRRPDLGVLARELEKLK